MSILKATYHHCDCSIWIEDEKTKYSFSFDLGQFTPERSTKLINEFSRVADSVEMYRPEMSEDEDLNPARVNIVNKSFYENGIYIFGTIEHMWEDDFSLGYLRFEQAIRMSANDLSCVSVFFLPITPENREILVADLRKIASQINTETRRFRQAQHVAFTQPYHDHRTYPQLGQHQVHSQVHSHVQPASPPRSHSFGQPLSQVHSHSQVQSASPSRSQQLGMQVSSSQPASPPRSQPPLSFGMQVSSPSSPSRVQVSSSSASSPSSSSRIQPASPFGTRR